MDEIITLDYGSGGKKTSRLIENMLLPAFSNSALEALGDGAILAGAEKLVFSTDSFVVSPLFFPGGDVGKLAVCGTVNDVAVCGGVPKYLSCAFVIEEGFETEKLARIVDSMARAAKAAGVEIVTGDTKVVERGRGDGVYINTAGIGFLKYPGLSPRKLQAGDAVIVSGTVGDHGTAVEAILSSGAAVRVLRDPTRGGVATTLCEFVEGSALSIELEEEKIPVRDGVRAACEMLGLDALYCANEGKLLCVAAEEDCGKVLDAMRATEQGKDAAVIGRVTESYPGKVVMKTAFGGSRILQKLAGAQLPRIC